MHQAFTCLKQFQFFLPFIFVLHVCYVFFIWLCNIVEFSADTVCRITKAIISGMIYMLCFDNVATEAGGSSGCQCLCYCYWNVLTEWWCQICCIGTSHTVLLQMVQRYLMRTGGLQLVWCFFLSIYSVGRLRRNEWSWWCEWVTDVGAQGELHLIESEITQLRENNLLQKKRLMETVSSVLKDLAEVGTAFGGELKVVIFTTSLVFQ